jgi:N-methylhydantoinase A/oxoprolinase/acetone carboxylase beta subunit
MHSFQSNLHLGVDVGGTNTDAAIVDGSTVVHWIKTPTTEDVTSGIINSLERVLSESHVAPPEIEGVMVGTTHFTNAIVEARHLLPTAVVRLCSSATRGVPPLTDWPDHLRTAVAGRTFMVDGGLEYDGRELAPVNREQLQTVADQIRSDGNRSVAITSVFSPADNRHEREAATIMSETLDTAAFSLSSEIGSLGLLERENATVMNASLRGIADQIVQGLEDALRELGLNAPLYLSQNDGTLMDAEYTNRYPVATFASGPTNSMRGAARLSQIKNCAVLDIGGTTSDIGILTDGFPREAPVAVQIAGVRTNFRMPDIHSIGIGGGSLVHTDGGLRVGPTSVGYRITEEALVFGGETLTATDIAVAAGLATVGEPERVQNLDPGLVQDTLDWIRTHIAEAVDQMKTSAEPIPLVIVGGGSIITTDEIPGTSRVLRPDHHQVANAVGAAIAEVGGQVDRIISLDDTPRVEAINTAKEQAVRNAVEAGAVNETVRIVEVEEIPLAYLPSNAVRIKVKAVGQLGNANATTD